MIKPGWSLGPTGKRQEVIVVAADEDQSLRTNVAKDLLECPAANVMMKLVCLSCRHTICLMRLISRGEKPLPNILRCGLGFGFQSEDRAHNFHYEPRTFHARKAMLQRFNLVNFWRGSYPDSRVFSKARAREGADWQGALIG